MTLWTDTNYTNPDTSGIISEIRGKNFYIQMKILQLCNRVPFPPKDGGSIAIHNLTKGLHDAGNEVSVLAMNTKKHFVELRNIPERYLSLAKLNVVYVDNSIKVKDAFCNLFSTKSYNIVRFISKDFEKKLVELLSHENFDIIQLESLFLAPYMESIRKNSKAKIVLRTHNVEFKIWERMAQTCPMGLKKMYLQLLAKRLKKYETEQLNKYDAIVTITAEDKKILEQHGCTIPIHVTPLGIDIHEYEIKNDVMEFPSLFHLGSMDWMPNEEAIQWFLDNVWNTVHLQFPDLIFYVAGRRMPTWLKKKKYPNVIIVEDVEDVKKFMNSKAIMLVPLLSGSGMRVKIIEGMALEKTIISTSIGAEGIEYTHLKDMLIANTVDEFVKMISRCVTDKVFCESIGKAARLLMEKQYSNKLISGKLINFYQELLND